MMFLKNAFMKSSFLNRAVCGSVRSGVSKKTIYIPKVQNIRRCAYYYCVSIYYSTLCSTNTATLYYYLRLLSVGPRAASQPKRPK